MNININIKYVLTVKPWTNIYFVELKFLHIGDADIAGMKDFIFLQNEFRSKR